MLTFIFGACTMIPPMILKRNWNSSIAMSSALTALAQRNLKITIGFTRKHLSKADKDFQQIAIPSTPKR
jgi:hypothetical protein